MRTEIPDMSFTRADIKSEFRQLLVDASGSEAATVYTMGILNCLHIAISKDCLECGYKGVCRNAEYKNGGAIIIPWDAKFGILVAVLSLSL
jgi:hypothetical protein